MGSISRRRFFHLTALGTVALEGGACSELVPPVLPRALPGADRVKTTVCGACAAGCGLNARVVAGNVVGLSGLPEHPVSDGGLCPRGLAEIQNLYHPERLKAPTQQAPKKTLSWSEASELLAQQLKGKQSAFVVGEETSFAERCLLSWLATKIGAKTFSVGRASRAPISYSADVGSSDCVLFLGVDFLQSWASPVEAQRAFANARRGKERRGKVITASARLSVTASHSDLWLPVSVGDEALFGLALANALLAKKEEAKSKLPESLVALLSEPRFSLEEASKTLGLTPKLFTRAVEWLSEAARPLVVSSNEPALAEVSALLNTLLGSFDREGGLVPQEPLPMPEGLVDAPFPPLERIPEGAAVVLFRANPVYLLPASLGMEGQLKEAPFVASFSSFVDESAGLARLVFPLSTALESRHLAAGHTMKGEPFVSAGPAVVPALYDSLEGVEALLRLAQGLDVTAPWKDGGEYLTALAGSMSAEDLLEDGGFAEPAPKEPESAPASAPSTAPTSLSVPSSTFEPASTPVSVPASVPTSVPASTLIATPASVPSTRAEQHLSEASVALLRAASGVVSAPSGYPMRLECFTPLAFLGGQGAHLPHLHGIAGPEGRAFWRTLVELHPSTARSLEIEEGAKVIVESAQGALIGYARLREGIRPDAVAIALGLGRRALGQFAEGYGDSPLRLVKAGEVTFVKVRRAR